MRGGFWSTIPSSCPILCFIGTPMSSHYYNSTIGISFVLGRYSKTMADTSSYILLNRGGGGGSKEGLIKKKCFFFLPPSLTKAIAIAVYWWWWITRWFCWPALNLHILPSIPFHTIESDCRTVRWRVCTGNFPVVWWGIVRYVQKW